MPARPTHTSYNAHPSRSRLASEPPVIPHNAGHAAKASAALQNEFLARSGLQNRRLNQAANDEANDGESGVGIAVSVPEFKEAQISKLDFITQLPTELAIHVLAYLNAAVLSQASLVSSQWKQIISNQHIWRESCLRETTNTCAMSGPVRPSMGLGIPQSVPTSDWRKIYQVKVELERRWKDGLAHPSYLGGHTDSIYCLQFDEYVDTPHWFPIDWHCTLLTKITGTR